MPVLSIQTNMKVANKETFLTSALALVANELSKPESYVMIHISDAQAMSFAGTSEPLAYVELKSLGLTSGQTASLSKHICNFLSETLSIDASRIYIEFSAPERVMFGWNGGTF
ncbi:phenylpyruvate tautomerase MIF-related protein [Ghiorsea bivora]|uniref:phenylpyruvate tautomerase MIF-related protein n=1 Tax=Ghiorsea bivora TaxID=1485545 RepID=UPI00056DCBA3|nr:phenylpyruvate tautomerase MIF-related protein [Ghiorsea bivora]